MADVELRSPQRPRARAALKNPRTLLSAQSWIDCALAALDYGGIDRVRVDVLAKSLEVTRGSFYWHFKDRDDLLARVLSAWRDAATEQLIERFEGKGGAPAELIRDLLSLPFRGRAAQRAARVELAIRAWARRDAMARHAVDEVDARRISYIAQCFSALGFGIAQARSRSFILYAHEVAESLLFNQGTSSQKMQRSRLVERLLLSAADDLT